MSTSTKCRIAICQFTATNNKKNNLSIVKRLVYNAEQQRAKMVFLPEGCDYIGSDIEESRALAEPLNGPLVTEYKHLARVHKLWVSIGGFHERVDEDTIYNCHILIDADGAIRSMYRKIHLFDVEIPEKNIFLKESDLTTSGSHIEPPTITPAGSLALSICYDLRFPEQSMLQTKLGAHILTYPSAFTHTTGKAHWAILLKARAIETQCYVIASAQYGKHNSKRISHGQSMVVDPWGTIIAECPAYTEGHDIDESMSLVDINMEKLIKFRQEMPALKHRRNDIYNLSLVKKGPLKFSQNEAYWFADKIIPSSHVFYITRHSYAFTNIRCVVPGHVLVSTLRVTSRLLDLTQEEIADLFKTVVIVQRAVEKEHNVESSTICIQDGRFAGQTVPHVHVHILPRKQGDFQRNDEIYEQLAKHDREDNPSPLRNSADMIGEAKRLRSYFV